MLNKILRQFLIGIALLFSLPNAFAGTDMYLYNQCLSNGGERNMCFQNAQTLDAPQNAQAPTSGFMQGYYQAQQQQAELRTRELENQQKQLEIERMRLENQQLQQNLNK